MSGNREHGSSANSGLSKEAAQAEVLIAALASGQRYAEAAAAAGVSERTVRRRMSDQRFAAQVAQSRSEYVSSLTGMLMSSAGRAVQVVLECLDSDKAADRLRAAELMLGMVRRFHGDVDVEARLTALEVEAIAGPGMEQGDE